jgi:predicted Zn-dependent protease
MEYQGDRRSAELILAHELGHVLGLDHVDDVDELMNAEYVGQTGFGPGDREGLKRLYDLPCA